MAQNQVIVKDRGLKKITKSLGKIGKDGLAAAVGIQGSEAEADHDGLTNAELGAIHEYGSQDGLIPERSHFRSTIDENETELMKSLGEVAKAVYKGEDAEGELRLVGEQYRGLVLRKIKGGIEPSLSEVTLAMGRGEGPPLIDTGQYWNAISTEIATFKEKQEG
jgi:hypothetical protein